MVSSEGAFRDLRKKMVLQTGVSEFVVPYSEPWSFESSNVNSPDFSQKASWVKEDAIFNPSSQPKVVLLSDFPMRHQQAAINIASNQAA